MQERLAEMKRKEAEAEAVEERKKKVVVGEVPDWAKTVKAGVDKDPKSEDKPVSTPSPVSTPAPANPPATAPLATAPLSAEGKTSPSPPPPPPPEDDYEDDDFEFDDDNSVVIGKDPEVKTPMRSARDEGERGLEQAPAPLEFNEIMDMSAINEDDADAPSLFYTSIEGGIMDNVDNMFENRAIGKDAELIKKDEDLLQFGDDDVDDSCYVKVMDDIAKGFLEGREHDVDDSGVRESLSKNFLRKHSEDMLEEVDEAIDAAAAEEDITFDVTSSVASSISIEQLEQSMQVPETSLKEERAILRNSERKKQTEDAVKQMRNKLSAMGFLSADEINPKTSNLDIEISMINEVMRPQTAPAASIAPTSTPESPITLTLQPLHPNTSTATP